jgi:hypothetical protein
MIAGPPIRTAAGRLAALRAFTLILLAAGYSRASAQLATDVGVGVPPPTHSGLGRTALPIIGIDPAQAANASLTALRHDWLLSYQPSADKVVFIGYGGNLGPQQLNEIRNLHRTRDRFFLKVSYPFRPGRRSPTA